MGRRGRSSFISILKRKGDSTDFRIAELAHFFQEESLEFSIVFPPSATDISKGQSIQERGSCWHTKLKHNPHYTTHHKARALWKRLKTRHRREPTTKISCLPLVYLYTVRSDGNDKRGSVLCRKARNRIKVSQRGIKRTMHWTFSARRKYIGLSVLLYRYDHWSLSWLCEIVL